jgi:hypothetical protein
MALLEQKLEQCNFLLTLLRTAKKIGNLWIISKDEPHIDHRKKGEGN